jgi:hypothetical protein
MKVNEIKKTVEQVVRVEYIAEDGKIFRSEDECRKYEESALFVASNELKRLNVNKYSSVYDLIGEGSEDDEVEIFDIQTEKDLENLKRYLYLTARKNGASESHIKGAFKSVDGKRKEYVFENVTIGHEVIVCWSYDKDWFWVHRDGSIEVYLSFLRDKMQKLITPETVTE